MLSVIEPYFDYSKYNEEPRYNMRDRNVLKCLPVTITVVDCDLSLDWLGPDDDDDDDDKKSGPKLERSRPISLSEVYKIAQQIQEEKEDYDKFISI